MNNLDKQYHNFNKKALFGELRYSHKPYVLLKQMYTVQTVLIQLSKLNVNEYFSFSTYTISDHLLAWFLTLCWRVFITFKQARKQALSRVTGAPSLITNMLKYVFRSEISGLPSGPCQSSVFLSANMQTNTRTKGHTLLRKKLYTQRRTQKYRYMYIQYMTQVWSWLS